MLVTWTKEVAVELRRCRRVWENARRVISRMMGSWGCHGGHSALWLAEADRQLGHPLSLDALEQRPVLVVGVERRLVLVWFHQISAFAWLPVRYVRGHSVTI